MKDLVKYTITTKVRGRPPGINQSPNLKLQPSRMKRRMLPSNSQRGPMP